MNPTTDVLSPYLFIDHINVLRKFTSNLSLKFEESAQRVSFVLLESPQCHDLSSSFKLKREVLGQAIPKGWVVDPPQGKQNSTRKSFFFFFLCRHT